MIKQNLALSMKKVSAVETENRLQANQDKLPVVEQEQRLLAQTLAEVTLTLTSKVNLTDVLDEILRQAQRLVSYDTANFVFIEGGRLVRIMRLRDEKGKLFAPQADHQLRELSNFPIDMQATQQKQPLVVMDTYKDKRWVIAEPRSWIRAYAVMPIYWQDDILGLLRLNGATPNKFSKEMLNRLQPLANAAAVALHNARLYEQLHQELQVRKQVEAALRHNETFTRTILNSLTAQIAVLNQQGEIVQVNQAWLNFANENGANLATYRGVGLNYLKICGEAKGVNSNEAYQTNKGLQAVLDGKISKFTLEYPCHSPTEKRWFQLHGVPLADYAEGGLVVSHTNITPLKKTEAALRRSQQKYRQRALELHSLYKVSLELNSQRPMKELITLICKRFVALVNAQGGCLIIHDKSINKFVVPVAIGLLEPLINLGPLSANPTTGLLGEVIKQKTPQIVQDYKTWPNRQDDEIKLLRNPLHAVLGVPLLKQQTVVGALEVTFDNPARTITQRDVRLAELFAAQAVLAIENIRLHETAQLQYQQLQESQSQLVQAEKMAALGRLTAAIAHEINNPLQAVQSCLTLIQDELAAELKSIELDELVTLADEEIQRIAGLIQRLRKFYHPTFNMPQTPQTKYPSTSLKQTQPDMKNGRDVLEPPPYDDLDVTNMFYQIDTEVWQTVDVHNILLDVFLLLETKLKRYNIEQVSKLHHCLPTIQGHSDHLKQLFLNLTLNAIEAMLKIGGQLIVSTQIEIFTSKDTPFSEIATNNSNLAELNLSAKQAVQIAFCDTGPGILPDVKHHLFEPFFTTKPHGSGLGLFTCYRIVEAHGGYINVDSQIGQGTTFTITLPVIQSIVSTT